MWKARMKVAEIDKIYRSLISAPTLKGDESVIIVRQKGWDFAVFSNEQDFSSFVLKKIIT